MASLCLWFIAELCDRVFFLCICLLPTLPSHGSQRTNLETPKGYPCTAFRPSSLVCRVACWFRLPLTLRRENARLTGCPLTQRSWPSRSPPNWNNRALALSADGLYFGNHRKSGVIGKYALGKNKEPENFIDLTEWISATGDVDLRVEGLRLDDENRLLIAEAGTGKLLRVSPDARKLEVLADSYDGYRFATVKAPSGQTISMPVLPTRARLPNPSQDRIRHPQRGLGPGGRTGHFGRQAPGGGRTGCIQGGIRHPR